MSSASSTLSPRMLERKNIDELIAARERINAILDYRARQSSLFDAPVLAPAVVAPPVPAPLQVSDVPRVLSPSSLNCFSQCEAKWFYRKVLQLPETRSAALGLGSAVHAAIAENFRQKIETGDDLPFAGVRALYYDAFAREFDSVTLTDDDDVDDLLHCGEALVSVYLADAAPGIDPAAVELPVEGVIGGVAVRGIVDLLDIHGHIIDLKTAAKKPAGFPGEHKLQVATYAMITPGASGVARLDTLTKTKTVALHSQTVEISTADKTHAEKLYSISLEQMQTGLVKPNRSSNLCSRKYCGFWETCMEDYGGVVD